MKDYEAEVSKLLKEDSYLHLVSGLSAEVGEVCAVFQKSCYKNQPLNRENLLEELGDVFFYATALANRFDMSIDEVLNHNIEKLKRRHG